MTLPSLTALQAYILRQLRRPLSAADLVATGVSQGSAGTILARLADRGLVEPQDEGRDRTWSLTDYGSRVVRALEAAEREMEDA